MENRGRQLGDSRPAIDPTEKQPQPGLSKLLHFREFKQVTGGGGRNRTDE